MATLADFRLGFLGAGNMAEAILKGVTDMAVLPASQVSLTDVSAERRQLMAERFGVMACPNNRALVESCDVVLFAVKPQNMLDVMAEIAPLCTPRHLFLSICAGKTSAQIEAGLAHAGHPAPRVVRIMPNTPALIGQGMAGLSRGAHATAEDLALADTIFRAVGETVLVEEFLMDGVTAVTGSGPAYVFLLIEGLIEAACQQGFDPDQARRMVLQLVRGAALLAHGSPMTPAELRRAVTSPGGTTAAGIAVLEERGLREALHACVAAAERRGKELAGG